ncbi:MAG: hydrolase [Sulfurospirillum sp.]|nr:MAG: hydrolase [Sulfurospirillum sp.]
MFNPLSNPHIQTLYATFAPKPDLHHLKWERFELPDGDFVDCVWYGENFAMQERPVTVLFHGLTGSVRSPYILRTMERLGKLGFAVVLMHFRGCSGESNRLPRSYHSGDTADATLWLHEVKKRYPNSPLFAVGFSLGGNMLLKLMGECGADALPDAAVAVSAPMDLAACAKRIDQGFSRLYQRHLMKPLKEQLIDKYRLFDMQALIGLRERDVARLKTFWEFDDVYTAPVHGFESVGEYYARCSAKRFLSGIVKPTLILHAEDDPFTGEDVIPGASDLPGDVTLEVHKQGGHIGFVHGSFMKPEFWLFERIADYLATFSSLPPLQR